jgi:hypothetical protein
LSAGFNSSRERLGVLSCLFFAKPLTSPCLSWRSISGAAEPGLSRMRSIAEGGASGSLASLTNPGRSPSSPPRHARRSRASHGDLGSPMLHYLDTEGSPRCDDFVAYLYAVDREGRNHDADEHRKRGSGATAPFCWSARWPCRVPAGRHLGSVRSPGRSCRAGRRSCFFYLLVMGRIAVRRPPESRPS